MDKEQFSTTISEHMKLVRTEQDYSQEKMADILGLSKKTLVQIEKGRTVASWTAVVAFCALFNHSELLYRVLGDEPLFLAQLIAQQTSETPKDKTLGGIFWWKEIDKLGEFQLQQNIVSGHFRILDQQNYRWYSSFEEEESKKRLQELFLEQS